MSTANCCHDSRHEFGRHQWSRRIVDEHHIDFVRQRDQRPCDGSLTGVTAGHNDDFGGIDLIGKDRRHLVDITLRRGHDHDVHRATGCQGPHRMHKHGDTTEQTQCLGCTGTEAFASTGSRNQDCGPRLRHVPSLGGKDLVEDRFGLDLVGLLGERKLTHEDLPSLGQHALLAG